MTQEAKEIRHLILETAFNGQDGNIPSAFSSVEIIWTIYRKVLNEADKFILSKGQSNIALLSIFAKLGYISKDDLKDFCKYHSKYSMQGDRTKIPQLQTSAGSLGHGFPIAAGMAWAAKIKNESTRVYTLVGDGELNEGTMWEAAIFCSSQKLNNLVMIVDDNNSISQLIDIGSLEQKLEAFGFNVVSVDGHQEEALEKAINIRCEKPLAVLAKTQRGFGSHTLMQERSWFHRAPKIEELKLLKDEVSSFSGE